MEILGMTPVAIAITITIIGIVLRTVIGMGGKPYADFNWQHIGLSFIIGFFATIQLVILAIQTLPSDTSELIQLAFVTGQIATVMGIDSAVKGGSKAVARKLKTQKETPNSSTNIVESNILNEELDDLDREDVPEELPPSRGP